MNTCLFIFLSVLLILNNINTVRSACPPQERTVLQNFYTASQPWYGTAYDWDNSSITDCCLLEGILCNQDNTSVIGIDGSSYGIYGNNANVDFSALTNLLSVNFNYNYNFVIASLVLPNTVQNLELYQVDISSLAKSAIQLPNLQTLSLSAVPGSEPYSLGYVAPNLTYINLPNTDFAINYSETPNLEKLIIKSSDQLIFEVACTLPHLKQLTVSSTADFSFPDIHPCILEKPLILIELTGFMGLGGPFPVFNNSLQSLYLEQATFDFPTELPKNIKEFSCITCFPNDVEIPMEWENYTSLVYLNLNDNIIIGEIPDFLIKNLYYGSFRGNLIEMEFSKFLNIRPGSMWDISDNNIYGTIPDDLQFLFKDTHISVEDNLHMKGLLPRYAYCLEDFIDFRSASDLLLLTTTNNNSNPDADLYQEVFTLTNDFNHQSENYQTYFCTVGYPDPNLPNFITPTPPNGGHITISGDDFFYRQMESLTLLNKKKEKIDMKTRYQQMKEKLFRDQNPTSTTPSISININGVNVQQQLGAISSPYDNIPDYNYTYNPYPFFRENFGFFQIYDVSNEILFKNLTCRILSWKNLVLCEDFPALINPSNYALQFYPNEYSSYPTFEVPCNFISFIAPPTVDNVVNLEQEGDVTIVGNSFGEDDQFLVAQVQFFANGLPDILCPVSFKNDSHIICQKPRNDENSNVIYNLRIAIGSQISNIIQLPYNPPASPPSDCYAADGNLCQGRGSCVANLCSCNSDYQGIFCESKSSDSQVVQSTVDSSSPSSTFDHPEASSQFIVNVQEIRELDIRQRIVNRYTPKWSVLSNNGGTHVFQSMIAGNSKVKVTLVEIAEPQTISFANSTLKTDPSTIKYTVSISNYHFASVTNTMQIVFAMNAIPSQSVTDKCGTVANTKFQSDPNQSDIKWVQLTRGNAKMTGKIINRSVIDSRVIIIKYQSEFVSDNTFNLVANVPYFKVDAVIDPSYSVLLNSNSDSGIPDESECGSKAKNNGWKIATGVTIGITAAIALAIGGYILYKKKKVELDFAKKMKNAGSVQ